MLRVLKEKLLRDHLRANVVCQDMRRLGFAQAFSLVILPFHAFAELVDPEDRALALRSIAGALSPGGRFVCTLHNPAVRRRSVGGEEKEIGRFAGPGPGTELRLYLRTELDARHQIVAGVQRIQVVDRSEQVVDSRIMPMRFALPGRDEVESMAAEAGLEATCLQGDYSGAPFDPVESPFMIWTFTRRTETPSGTSRRPTGDSGGERAC
jgi:SAM-dependent methyltransferase